MIRFDIVFYLVQSKNQSNMYLFKLLALNWYFELKYQASVLAYSIENRNQFYNIEIRNIQSGFTNY